VGWVRIGAVVRAVGLGGHLGVGGSAGGIGGLGRVALRRPGAQPEVHEILEARPQGRVWAVRVAGVADRAAAEGWVGAEVLAERGDLGEAGEGRHYWADLEGLPVQTAAGEPLGRVTGLLETGGVDVLVVAGKAGEVLVPLAPYAKVEPGRVVVDPPQGLIPAAGTEEDGANRGRRGRR
jgi:16S rRNA processing protein RimM